MFTFRLIGNDEAARAYTMIEPIKRTLGEIDELMRYRNYQPAIDRITEVIEVRIRFFLERMLPLEEASRHENLYTYLLYILILASSMVSKATRITCRRLYGCREYYTRN